MSGKKKKIKKYLKINNFIDRMEIWKGPGH